MILFCITLSFQNCGKFTGIEAEEVSLQSNTPNSTPDLIDEQTNEQTSDLTSQLNRNPLINSDLQAMKAIQINFSGDAELANAYRVFFGEATGVSLVEFMDKRVYRWYHANEFLNSTQPASNVAFSYTPDSSLQENSAANVMIGDWLSGFFLNSYYPVGFLGESIHIDSPTRKGIVVIYDSYNDPNYYGDILEARLSILMHEARHSDCSMSPSTLRGFASQFNSIDNFLDTLDRDHPECTQAHSLCSSQTGPELAGLYACDAHPWGSYYSEVILLKSLINQANEADKALLTMFLISVQNSLDYNWLDYYQGKMGPPDMKMEW